MTRLLDGHIALVTGATGGLGHGICRALAQAGAQVVVHYRSAEQVASQLADELGGQAMPAELTSSTLVNALIKRIEDELGALDIVVNNAGIQPVSPLASMSETQFSDVLAANLTSAHLVTQAAVPLLADRGGSIIHIASIEGHQSSFGHAHYATSKAALLMHARAAALEYGPLGIRVNTISPGLVEREHLEQQWPEGVERYRQAAPLRRLGTPADIGHACVFLASSQAAWITGTDLIVDGGVSVHPTW